MARLKANRHVNQQASTRVRRARAVDLQHMTSAQLSSYIANEGKRLNQQLVEIEKRNMQSASYAFERLTSNPNYSRYLGTSKSGHTKVNLSTRGMTRGQKQQLAKVIEKFAGAKTITVSGIESYNRNVAGALKAHYTDMDKLTDIQLTDILKTEGFAHMKATVGSETVMRMIASAQSPEVMLDFLRSSGAIETRAKALKDYGKINRQASRTWQPVTGFNPFDVV